MKVGHTLEGIQMWPLLCFHPYSLWPCHSASMVLTVSVCPGEVSTGHFILYMMLHWDKERVL